METADRSRRHFLATLIFALAGLLLLRRFLTPRRPPVPRTLSFAREEIPPAGALVYRESRVAVIRDRDELYALDLVCTHLGCTVSVTATGLVCPCHGSRFDLRGNPVHGPATRPLKRYPVRLDPDAIVVICS